MRKKSPPEQIGSFLNRYFAKRGWHSKLEEYRLWTHWEELVGKNLARRCWPLKFRHRILTIAVTSASWVTQLQFIKSSLLDKFKNTLRIQLDDIHFVAKPMDTQKRDSRIL